jgi:hypothetical protein
MITVPVYLLVGQVVLLLLACFVLASAYRRLGKPVEAAHGQGEDEAVRLIGTPLPDLGAMIATDGSSAPPPRTPGPGEPVLLVYVLPGCETCQAALARLEPLLGNTAHAPTVHLLSTGSHSSVDAYRRFGLPTWRAERNLADIFGLKAYPVFLAVDKHGMIKAAGSAHDPDALRSYLTVGALPPASGQPQPITIPNKP